MASVTLLFFTAIFSTHLQIISAATVLLPHDTYHLHNKPKSWTNNGKSFSKTVNFSDGSTARFILLHTAKGGSFEDNGSSRTPLDRYGFGFCFYCASSSCYLSTVFVEMANRLVAQTPPQIVWSANRDKPVRENAVLTFFPDGDLVLYDADGSPIWSSNTRLFQSVSGININKLGNVLIFDKTNRSVWQSFDHPTDTILLGQLFRRGQKLTSSVSSKNTSSGYFSLQINSTYLSAYASGDTPALYLTVNTHISSVHRPKLKYVLFDRGGLTFSFHFLKPSSSSPRRKRTKVKLETPSSASTQLLRLDTDGGLRIYGWQAQNGWRVIHYFTNKMDDCWFPLKCGRFGVCQDGQCTCPGAVHGINFFTPVDDRFPNLGCNKIHHSAVQELVHFGPLSYFTSFDGDAAVAGLESEESCTRACAEKGSSCNAAIFKYDKKRSKGKCYLVSEVLSLIGTPISSDYNVSSYIKVQVPPPPPPSYGDASFSVSKLLLTVMVTCACVILAVILCFWLRRRSQFCEDDETCLEKFLSKTLQRFSYSELSMATDNFSKKLGGGGFGQVFKGTLKDGKEIAVKRLEKTGQGTKEFLAEVDTVGNIHHINLVKLIGFCVENMHRILVYEYLSNGSLDKWIFHQDTNSSLDWKTRKKILFHIAKGLAYIHEECRQKIAHLDVKPHNILLDDSFNAKISDFGMSKLISREESQVMTRIRGTLGYLAPEWQGSRITVKADVYSYGILLLEVVSGRMVLDYSQPESEVHLLKLLQKKCIENQLMHIVDIKCEDMVHNGEECVEMIKLGLWCLHSDYRRRPAMSLVVKVLEGSVGFETNFTYNFSSALSPVCSHVCK